MRNIRTAMTAGAAAVAAIGFCGAALAQSPQAHTLTLALPGGGVEQILYTGSVAPQVYVSDAPAPAFVALPSVFGAASPFAELERISAAMDREAAQMLREAAAVSAAPGGAPIDVAALANLPAGSREYSFISTMNGNGVCSRSVEITAEGNGAPPRVVTHSSGNCTAAAMPGAPALGTPVPTQLPTAPAPRSGPRMIMTKATGAVPAGGRIEEAALR